MDLDDPGEDPLADVDTDEQEVGAPIEPVAVLVIVLLAVAVLIVAARV